MLIIKGAIEESTINLIGGQSSISGPSNSLLSFSGGSHQINGNSNNTPLKVSGSAEVTLSKMIFMSSNIELLGGTVKASGVSFHHVTAHLSGGTLTIDSNTSIDSSWKTSGSAVFNANATFSNGNISINWVAVYFIWPTHRSFTCVHFSSCVHHWKCPQKCGFVCL